MSAARQPDDRFPEHDDSWRVDRGVTVGPWHGSAHEGPSGDSVRIDCDTCTVRGSGCGDCVVAVLLGGPPAGVELDAEEQQALEALADGGLVPPLRMAGPAPRDTGRDATEPLPWDRD